MSSKTVAERNTLIKSGIGNIAITRLVTIVTFTAITSQHTAVRARYFAELLATFVDDTIDRTTKSDCAA